MTTEEALDHCQLNDVAQHSAHGGLRTAIDDLRHDLPRCAPPPSECYGITA